MPTLLRHFADPKVAVAAPRIAGLGDRLDLARPVRGHALLARPRPAPRRRAAAVATRLGDDGVRGRSASRRWRRGSTASLRIGEDVDLGWRLVDAGWRVRYEPTAVAHHEHRERPVDWFLRKAVYGSGAQGLAERHPDYIAPAVLAPWSAAFVVLLLVQRRWSWAAAGGVAVVAGVRIGRQLRPLDHPYAAGIRLAGAGAVSATAQGMALLLRHWWPAALVACLVSKRARRAVLVSALVDVALEYRRNPAHLDPLRFGVARRLDDLAYGSGVWWGALRAHSVRSAQAGDRPHHQAHDRAHASGRRCGAEASRSVSTAATAG